MAAGLSQGVPPDRSDGESGTAIGDRPDIVIALRRLEQLVLDQARLLTDVVEWLATIRPSVAGTSSVRPPGAYRMPTAADWRVMEPERQARPRVCRTCDHVECADLASGWCLPHRLDLAETMNRLWLATSEFTGPYRRSG